MTQKTLRILVMMVAFILVAIDLAVFILTLKAPELEDRAFMLVGSATGIIAGLCIAFYLYRQSTSKKN